MSRAIRNVHVKIQGSDLDLIEDWRRSQKEIPAMAAAIRTLALREASRASADVKPPSIKDAAA
jgi:hypothetical protein